MFVCLLDTPGSMLLWGDNVVEEHSNWWTNPQIVFYEIKPWSTKRKSISPTTFLNFVIVHLFWGYYHFVVVTPRCACCPGGLNRWLVMGWPGRDPWFFAVWKGPGAIHTFVWFGLVILKWSPILICGAQLTAATKFAVIISTHGKSKCSITVIGESEISPRNNTTTIGVVIFVLL